MRAIARRLTAGVAVAYVAALAVAAFLLRFVGERWWATCVVLYLPRVFFFAPLPIVVVALPALRMRRLLWTQAAAALLVLFPLMGGVLPWAHGKDESKPSLRLLSFNVNSGYDGYDKVLAAVRGYNPDIVLFQ